MLGLFKTKKNHFVGIDFGTSSIKVVELSLSGGKIVLENYGIADLNAVFAGGEIRNSKVQSYEEKLKECLLDLLGVMGLAKSGCRGYVAIPGASGLIALIEFPEMKQEELANAIQFESHKYIPLALEDVAVSWEVVGKREESHATPGREEMKKNKLQVLLVAAPKKEIVRYQNLLGVTSLSVGAIELETFSIVRAVTGEEEGNFIVVDIGARATNIVLVEKNVVKVNRNIDAGGNEITGTIAEGMNISKQRAEILKKGDKDLLNDKDSPIIIPVLELIVGEVMRIIAAYKGKSPEARIDSIILSGGSAQLTGLVQYFSRMTGIQAAAGNPWRKITYDAKLQGAIDKMGSSFAAAIGLALRGVEDYQREK